MEAQLSLGPPPAMSILAVVPAIADPTEPGRIRLHHASQRRDARRQAESLEARSDLLPSLFNDCRRDNLGRCGTLPHGVALLRGLSTPSLLAQGGQRLPHIFNIGRDISGGDIAAAHKLLTQALSIFEAVGTRDEPAKVRAALGGLERLSRLVSEGERAPTRLLPSSGTTPDTFS